MKPKASSTRRKALGRGLNALIAKPPAGPAAAAATARQATPPPPAETGAETVRSLPVARIDPNPDQPRTRFDAAAVEELAQSIRTDGIIQPILVRPSGDRYLIVAGERRWRAAKQAGLAEIPAIVRDIGDERLLEIALIENIQREDLNPIEVAQALRRLAQELQLSHEELAQRTGKDRSTISNLLRLLRLPIEVQNLVAEDQLSMGHARAVLALEHETQQIEVAERVVAQGLSVRAVEKLIKSMLEPPAKPDPEPLDPNVAAAETRLTEVLGTPVRLKSRGKNKGRIEIDYSSQDELDRIYSLLTDDE